MDDSELRRAQEDRLHILEAMRLVIDRRAEFLDVVGLSASADEARVAVQEAFELDELQAAATLDLQVRRFASLERGRIAEECDEMRGLVRGDDGTTFDQLIERTQQVADGVVGLSEAAARAAASAHPDLQFEFVAWDGTVSMDLRSNRIRVWLRDGMVESATAG